MIFQKKKKKFGDLTLIQLGNWMFFFLAENN